MKLTEVDKIILKAASKKGMCATQILGEILDTTGKFCALSHFYARAGMLCGVDLITFNNESSPATYAITELGEKLLRAGEKSRQKEQKEGGRCNLS